MHKLVQYLQVALVGVLTMICVQLVITYQFFTQQVQELCYLKEEYQSYCIAYRQLLTAAQQHVEKHGGAMACADIEDELLCQECNERFMQQPRVEPKVAAAPTKKNPVTHPLFKKFKARWPIERTQFWISSKFGPRKKRNGSLGFHYGVDMAALKGTPVHAVCGGTVIEAAFSKKGYGKSIVLKHADGITTRYAHLDNMFVKKGQPVEAGECIGCVGATGHVWGKNASHLHLEIMAHGKHVDPLTVLA